MAYIHKTIPKVDSFKPIRTFHMARLMGKHKMAAARIRARFLRVQIDLHRQTDEPIANFWADEMEAEMNQLLTEGKAYSPIVSSNGITDADIEAARTYPVDSLVEIVRGKTRAWCHNDTVPSAFHATRTNRIICPVCNNRKFNAVDILMSRDGYSFIDAVKALR